LFERTDSTLNTKSSPPNGKILHHQNPPIVGPDLIHETKATAFVPIDRFPENTLNWKFLERYIGVPYERFEIR